MVNTGSGTVSSKTASVRIAAFSFFCRQSARQAAGLCSRSSAFQPGEEFRARWRHPRSRLTSSPTGRFAVTCHPHRLELIDSRKPISRVKGLDYFARLNESVLPGHGVKSTPRGSASAPAGVQHEAGPRCHVRAVRV